MHDLTKRPSVTTPVPVQPGVNPGRPLPAAVPIAPISPEVPTAPVTEKKPIPANPHRSSQAHIAPKEWAV